MFSLKSLWEKWMHSEETGESPGRGNDYADRREPPMSDRAAAPDSETPSPEAALPDLTLWTPRLLTV